MIVLRSMFASAAVVATFAGATAIASAAPVDDSTEAAAGCQYTLTAPELVLLPGGAKAVRATMNPKTCDPAAQPTDVTVCVSTPNSPGLCKKLPGWSTPEVLVPASPASGTFTATGEGCWQEVTRSLQSACRTVAPISSTF